ncbi:hypothetical protein K402DRAFT_309406, partial [Aulographum hederae CBS 113979]
DGCSCVKGTKQGQYCYGCKQVYWYKDHSYNNLHECNPDGGCCNYGYSKTCAARKEKC